MTPFIDICLNALLVFILLFNPEQEKKKSEGLPTFGEYAIVVSWNDKSEDDVDTYVRDPQGRIVFFTSKDNGLLHLERDDYGMSNDTTKSVDGTTIQVEGNQERVIIRGIVPGEYIVNVHMYAKRDKTPTRVQIALLDIKREGAVVTEAVVVLEKERQESTAFRFSLETSGQVTKINRVPYVFVKPTFPP